jgi:zeaxanthin glucosyltransferase
MKIGFICPTVPGHLNPMTALARHLQARNHEVVFLYSSSANGLPYVPGDKDDDLNASRREISKLEGDGAIAFFSILPNLWKIKTAEKAWTKLNEARIL